MSKNDITAMYEEGRRLLAEYDAVCHEPQWDRLAEFMVHNASTLLNPACLAEDAQGPLCGPEIMMREAIWVELGAALFDVPVEQVNRAVRAGYCAALRALGGE